MRNRTGERIVEYHLNCNICPICLSKSVSRTKVIYGDWVKEFRCNNCKSIYEHNEGDKMGGQFDQIIILQDNHNQ